MAGPGRPPIDLNQKVRELLSHTDDSPDVDAAPIRNFEQRIGSGDRLVHYIDRHLDAEKIYATVLDRHMALLNRMTLVMMIESFERFIKELAVVCVDCLSQYAIDDRFDKLTASPGIVALQFGSGSVGRALCESDTWLNNSLINDRFRSILKPPFGDKVWDEFLYPKPRQQPQTEQDRAATLAILWQVRHTITHNVGHLTAADAKRLRLLIKGDVAAEQTLAPDRKDLKYVQQFLTETALHTNQRISNRLADVLTDFHTEDATLFTPQEIATNLAKRFQVSMTIAGATANP